MTVSNLKLYSDMRYWLLFEKLTPGRGGWIWKTPFVLMSLGVRIHAKPVAWAQAKILGVGEIMYVTL